MRVLDAYKAAYAAGDIKALQSVQVLPSALQKSVASEFANARTRCKSRRKHQCGADGRTAVVNAARDAESRRFGGTGRTATNVERFMLEKRRGRWMIVSPPPSLF